MSSLWGLVAIGACVWLAYQLGKMDEEQKWLLGEKKRRPIVDCHIYDEEG